MGRLAYRRWDRWPRASGGNAAARPPGCGGRERPAALPGRVPSAQPYGLANRASVNFSCRSRFCAIEAISISAESDADCTRHKPTKCRRPGLRRNAGPNAGKGVARYSHYSRSVSPRAAWTLQGRLSRPRAGHPNTASFDRLVKPTAQNFISRRAYAWRP